MIRLVDVIKEYPNGTHALNGLSLEIKDGEFVFMVGPSGSGKSTVIRLLIGEVEPTDGRVMVNGFSLRNIREWQIPHLRRTVGVIFQDFRLIEHKTVYDNMVFAMRAVGASSKEIKKRVPYCLENPMDGGAWWATVHGVAKSQTRLSDFTFTSLSQSFQTKSTFSLSSW